MKEKNDSIFTIQRIAFSILIALALVIVVIYMISSDPRNAIHQFLFMAMKTKRNFGNVLELSIPLIFTGLSVCIMFNARQFTMISEGAFFIGGLASTIFVLYVPMPAGVNSFFAILFGGLVGACAGGLIGFFKAKWKTNEFVMSLMLNYVLLYFGVFMLRSFIRDPNKGALASYAIPESAKLSKVLQGTRLHSGFYIAILCIILCYLFLYKTVWGYKIRMTGYNENFSDYIGISTGKVIIGSQLIGGFIAGIGGSTEILGMYVRFQWSSLPGYGFDGIMVATLAQLNPIFVPFAAVFLAYMRIGADIMARNSDVPSEVVIIIQAIIIVLVASSGFLAKWKNKRLLSNTKKSLASGGES